MEIAGVDVTDRNPDLTDRVAKCFRQLFAPLVEIALAMSLKLKVSVSA